ncbi:MAG: hypothetical protein HYZ15_04655 [Sphingobacteriales bacterium]|nr:hypothetical protein [Sphingobacteriales bacterium]
MEMTFPLKKCMILSKKGQLGRKLLREKVNGFFATGKRVKEIEMQMIQVIVNHKYVEGI